MTSGHTTIDALPSGSLRVVGCGMKSISSKAGSQQCLEYGGWSHQEQIVSANSLQLTALSLAEMPRVLFQLVEKIHTVLSHDIYLPQ